MKGIIIREGGALTTVQDLGRYGYQHVGFGTSGVMDRVSFQIANLLLGNDRNEAALEATLLGPSIEFCQDNCFVLTGADMDAKLDGKPVPGYQVISACAGSILKLGFARKGLRGYVAFAGGMEIEKAMGSCSTSLKYELGGFNGRKLAAGDEIGFRQPVRELSHMERRRTTVPSFEKKKLEIKVIPGPQEEYFTKEGIKTFFESRYRIKPESDRMGYRLEGNPVPYRESADIISDATVAGAIQIPADGKPIILLADRQTTGGYAKLGAVRSADLPLLAQAAVGTEIQFVPCGVSEAQRALAKEEKLYRRLERRINRWI